ncbi:MAG TPA: hypothetical protein VGJ30_04910 [Candidatus Angelobacter sp.]
MSNLFVFFEPIKKATGFGGLSSKFWGVSVFFFVTGVMKVKGVVKRGPQPPSAAWCFSAS